MQELRFGLEAFFRGEMALEGLLSAIDRAFIENPDSVSEFHEQVRDLYNKGRLPPQLFSIFQQQIETASKRLGAAPQQASRSAQVARPALSDAPTTVSPSPWASAGSSSPSVPDAWSAGQAPARDGLTEVIDGPSGETGARTGPAGVGADPSRVGVTTGGTSIYPSHAQVSGAQVSGTGGRSSGYLSSSYDFPARPDEPRVGQVLNDRFELVQLLGCGGMSVVFKVRDRRKVEALDRHPHIALKLLNADFKRHPESLKTLQREARKAQGLKHPNVISIFDFDKDEHDN